MTSVPRAAPAAGRGVPDEKELGKQLEKHMGCMAGFLQLFDRHQILAAKRIYAAKRLPSSPAAGSTSPSDRSDASVVSLVKEAPEECPSSPESSASKEVPARPSLPLPVFDFKEGLRSSWKLREAPRLSLDSRATIDAKGKLRPREIRTTPVSGPNAAAEEQDRQRRSPSVVARLMGLEALPDFVEPVKNAELRRSASESRVSRDLSRFLDSSGFQKPLPPPPAPPPATLEVFRSRAPDVFDFRFREARADLAPRAPSAPPLQRKSFFETRDFFPEPKQSASLYGEIERRLRMRGIDEPARDLETLKQILEALQLKGLLHSRPQAHHDPINSRRNIIYDDEGRSRSGCESPIVVIQPAARPPRKAGNEPPSMPSRSGRPRPPRRDRAEMDRSLRAGNERRGIRSARSPDPSEASRSPSSPARRRPVNPEPQSNARAQAQRRINSVRSPRTSPRRNGPEPMMAVGSPRNRRLAVEVSAVETVYSPAEDDVSTVVSESSLSASSQLDFERPRLEYRSGRSLLERCDKLLHSIAAITSAEQVAAVEQQPSPVSVLDSSSFLCDERSASPVATKRSIDFTTDELAEWEEGHWGQAISGIRWKPGEEPDPEDPDFLYVSDIILASDRHRDLDSDLYSLLERRHQEAGWTPLHLRLLFDTVAEIMERLSHVSPWEAFSRAGPAAAPSGPSLLRGVWAELRRVREHVPADDLNDVTCGAIRKDMARERGWETPSVGMPDAVLHIERQVFKDLVADTIRELADLGAGCRTMVMPSRRKLVF